MLRAPTGNPDPGAFRVIRVDAAGDGVVVVRTDEFDVEYV